MITSELFLTFFLFVLLLVVALMMGLIFLSITYFIGAPWTPTEERVVRKMLKMAGANNRTKVYDLGSGDGRIIIMAAKEFGADGVGIEINPFLILWSKFSAIFNGVRKKTKFVLNNFFNADLSDADIVTLFLLQPTNIKLKHKLSKELKHGARVVSYRFTFPYWKLKKKDAKDKIYLYAM